jgi:hypothetical protein
VHGPARKRDGGDLLVHKLLKKRWDMLVLSLGPTSFDKVVTSFNETLFGQSLAKTGCKMTEGTRRGLLMKPITTRPACALTESGKPKALPIAAMNSRRLIQ